VLCVAYGFVDFEDRRDAQVYFVHFALLTGLQVICSIVIEKCLVCRGFIHCVNVFFRICTSVVTASPCAQQIMYVVEILMLSTVSFQ